MREYKATECDLRVLAEIARYHAAKKRAAVQLEFFRLTKDKGRLPLALENIKGAQSHWNSIVALTTGIYTNKMVFGHTKAHNSDFADRLQIHGGHWKDQVGEVQADVDFVINLMKQHGLVTEKDCLEAGKTLRRYPGETPLKNKPVIQHQRVLSTLPGKDIEIAARIRSDQPLRDVSVYYRAVNQTRTWKQIAMSERGAGHYSAVIPGGDVVPEYDLQYYLEARVASGGVFWPDWQNEEPYVVIGLAR